MIFNDKLNEYIELLNCTAKELSDASLISPAVISRYRKGERVPKYPSEQFDALLSGIISIAKEKELKLSEVELKKEFISSLGVSEIDFDNFRDNLNILISTLSINVADMSRFIGYDSSYLSKIRSGSRKPQNLADFINAVCKYVINNYTNNVDKSKLSYLLNLDSETLKSKEKIKDALLHWLSKSDNIEANADPTESFLTKLDDFDLNEYIKAIHFDTLKVPTLPVSFPKSKNYYGLEGFKESQIDTIKAIALSRSHNDVYFYSNMSIVEASKDIDFTKKFMFGLAACLKKGLRINMIHDVDRPYKEMILGLEGWLPLYMTGLVTPHYLKNNGNEVFSHITCTNGNVALNGYYAFGNISNATFYFTNKKEELNFYVENTKSIWRKSNPLMDIYTVDKIKEFRELFNDSIKIKEGRINILSNPPFYTISEKLLNKILDRNEIPKEDKEKISNHLTIEKERVITLLKEVKFTDEISVLSEEEFDEVKPSLSLSYMFYDKKIRYNYDEYLEHIELVKKFMKENKNYSFKQTTRNAFKNINLSIISGNRVIISKENAPSIHFAIYHPNLVEAIEKIEIPLIE